MSLLRNTGSSAILLIIALILSTAAYGDTTSGNNLNKKFGIAVSGHWNSLRNGKLNNYYIYQLNPEGDRITSGYGFSSEFRYFISHKISLGGGIIFISGSSDLNTIIWDPLDPQGPDTVSANYYIKTRLLAPTFSIRYHVYFEKTNISLGIGESFIFGKASSNFSFFSPRLGSQMTEYNYSSTGMGFLFFGAIDYRFSRNISYLIELGYRKFSTGDLVDKEDNLSMRYGFVNNSGIANLDYSGIKPFDIIRF
jgi:hypothetical protein